MKKVYICSSVRASVYDRVTGILEQLPPAIHLRPRQDVEGQKINHVEIDVAMIHHCDEVWVLGEFGRDCSWEIGYATAVGKHIIMFVDETNRNFVEKDWMYNHGINKGLLQVVELSSAVREPFRTLGMVK